MVATEKYPCIVVDDDDASRLIMGKLVEKESDFPLLGSFSSGEEALSFLEMHPEVSVIFLDINMPGLTGMDLIRSLPENHTIKTILVSSAAEHAVDAFSLDVVDYVLKPLTAERFAESLTRLRRGFEADKASGKTGNRELFIKTGVKYIRINIEEVAYVEALSDYVILFTESGQKHIVHSTMKAMEDKLTPLGFQRVHRSYIVNMRKVESVSDHQVKVAGKFVPVSKSYQDEFYKLLKEST